MTRLVVWCFSFIIILDLVCSTPRFVRKGKVHKNLENGSKLLASKAIKRSGENDESLNAPDVNKNAAEEQEGNGEIESPQNNENDNDVNVDDKNANDDDDDTNNNEVHENDTNDNDNDVNENDQAVNENVEDANDNNANENDENFNENDENVNDNDEAVNENYVNENDDNVNDNDEAVNENDENVNENDEAINENDEDVNENDDDANDKDININDMDANVNNVDENNDDVNKNENDNDANDHDANNNDKDINDKDAYENDNNGHDKNENDANNNDALDVSDDSNTNDKPNSEENKNEEKDAMNNLQRRPLKFGDILTPQELMPVVTKLIQKVDYPGQGKGIVSSAKSPEVLADRLFEAFFLTSKRIVKLTDFDISGIDALQALALSGDVVDDYETPETENMSKTNLYLIIDGEKLGISNRTSKYKLMSKLDDDNDALRKKVKRQGTLHKKKEHRLLRKSKRKELNTKNMGNQRSVIKAKNKSTKRKLRSRLGSKESKGAKTNGVANNKYPKKNILTTSGSTISLPSHKEGRWRYECVDPADLDTCHLNVKYIEPGSKDPVIGVKHNEDDPTTLNKQFRKMLKLSPIDEELEKIIENRVIRLRPYQGTDESIETLNEYFNRIIINEQKSITSPMSESESSNIPHDAGDENGDEGHNKKSEELEEHEKNDPNGRRILGIPSIPTPRPYISHTMH